MAARILASTLVAVSLLAAPAAFAQTAATPGHSEATTTTTDKMTSDTDNAGKTVTKHHKVVKHKAKAKAKAASTDTTSTTSNAGQ
jgi:Ni/Co efflux regulator RcnB